MSVKFIHSSLVYFLSVKLIQTIFWHTFVKCLVRVKLEMHLKKTSFCIGT